MRFFIHREKIFNKKIEIKFDNLIERIINDFSDHENIKRPRIIRWISQFPEKNRYLCEKIIDSIKYYSASNIQKMVSELVQIIINENEKVSKKEIFFVPIGSAGSASQLIARHLKSISGVANSNIVNLFELLKIVKDKPKSILVFIDDFSGTGNTIKDWWYNIEPLILPLDMKVILGILVLNEKADPELRKITNNLHFIDYLDHGNDMLGSVSNTFSEDEKKELVKLCKKTGCSQKYVKGWGDCGLLVAFKHGCPNNSLPILWHKSTEWQNLFARRIA